MEVAFLQFATGLNLYN